MKLCNCGQTIYDEPEQRYDKCRSCTAKSFKTKAERNLFLGGNFYRRNMREEIAKIIIDEFEGKGQGKPSMVTQIIDLIYSEIEKVELAQDDMDFFYMTAEDGFDRAKRLILNLLRPKENVVGSVEDF